MYTTKKQTTGRRHKQQYRLLDIFKHEYLKQPLPFFFNFDDFKFGFNFYFFSTLHLFPTKTQTHG